MNEKFVITGGKPLTGTVSISGAKNVAVAILPATILAKGVCTIENLPQISDVRLLLNILKELGAKIEVLDTASGSIRIDTSEVNTCHATSQLMTRLRASYYFVGAFLGLCNEAEALLPGGCAIGKRPIDLHIKGFEALGAKVEIENASLLASAKELNGADIYLDQASVGATINIMFAACMANGRTTITNAAKEPHVVDVANFLNRMGASIRGAGTDTIRIRGVKKMHGCSYSVIPDQIEAGTFMLAAAATKGDVIVQNLIPVHMEALTTKLIEMGVDIEFLVVLLAFGLDNRHIFAYDLVNLRHQSRVICVLALYLQLIIDFANSIFVTMCFRRNFALLNVLKHSEKLTCLNLKTLLNIIGCAHSIRTCFYQSKLCKIIRIDHRLQGELLFRHIRFNSFDRVLNFCN